MKITTEPNTIPRTNENPKKVVFLSLSYIIPELILLTCQQPVTFLLSHFAQCPNAGDDGLYGLGYCSEQLEAVFHADLYAVIAVSYGIVG